MSALPLHILPLLVGLLVKETLLLLVACAAYLALRRASAAFRHLIWSAAIGGVLVLPILSLTLPGWNIAWNRAEPPLLVAATPASPPSAAGMAPREGEGAGAQPSAPARQIAMNRSATTAFPSASSLPTGTDGSLPIPLASPVAGAVIWSVGSLLVLGQLLVGLRRVRRIKREAVLLDGEALAAAEAACRRLDIWRGVFFRAAEGSGMAVPITWGAFRPVVLLPEQSGKWSQECLTAALLHELAHVRRWDWLTQVAGRIACALIWWHPLVWLAARQARECSEQACDDLVLGTGMRPADYAQMLVEVVRSMPPGASSPAGAIAMARPSEVAGRLEAVLAKGRNRRPVPKGLMVLVLLTALVLSLPLAALRLKAQAAGVTFQRRDGGLLTISPTSYKLVYPDNLIFELARHQDDPVLAASGDSATLPNGYTVQVAGIARMVNKNGKWGYVSGPGWAPDGAPLPPFRMDMQFRKGPIRDTDGIAPTYVNSAITSPAGMPLTADQSDPSWIDVEEELFGSTTRTSPFSYRFPGGNVVIDGLDAVFARGARVCTLRCAIAAGPWNTVASLPFWPGSRSAGGATAQPLPFRADARIKLDDRAGVIYHDATGRMHVDYFLGKDQLLGPVARRVVAVTASGKTDIHQQASIDMFMPSIDSLAFQGDSPSAQYCSGVDLNQVVELLLQTRPYHVVDFKGIQLQPRRSTRSTVTH